MKSTKRISILALAAALAFFFLSTSAFAKAFKSPSLGGATGLVSTPTAHTGWEDASLGLDFGYHYISPEDGTHIPKFTLQLFGRWELGGTIDIQAGDSETDYLFHTKFVFLKGATSLAVGGNLQMINNGENNSQSNGQIYLAATYSGNFFNMQAETTIVIGKTFGENSPVGNVDFSMGFDLDLIPSLFRGYVHWINDFANYSYSMDPVGADTNYRACFNTGMRIAILRTSRYKFNIDVIMTDALDSGRGFSAGAAFGLAI
ncbi:MAG: hypothetical protein GY754_21655 [bacterium]|nr:hypothetical protein [bacterium]